MQSARRARLAGMTVELEMGCDRDDQRARAPLADGEVTTRGRSRADGGGIEEKARAQPGGNELGLLGMDCKQEVSLRSVIWLMICTLR